MCLINENANLLFYQESLSIKNQKILQIFDIFKFWTPEPTGLGSNFLSKCVNMSMKYSQKLNLSGPVFISNEKVNLVFGSVQAIFPRFVNNYF